jgi:HEPN domain-containing protein
MTKFHWPSYPQTQSEFEALMEAIDTDLARGGLKPFQRPLHAGRKFWEAFEWSGLLCPPLEISNIAGFEGDVLMAKAYRWYEQNYGDKLKSDFAFGFAPAKLGNALWNVRACVVYGRVALFVDRNLRNRGVEIGGRGVGASYNVLCAVENLPQGLVDRLDDKSLVEYFEFYVFMHQSLQWRNDLPRLELFNMARADYDSATADVICHRYGQARWGAEQAVEKTLKGLLTLGGTKFSKGGPNGHNLKNLAELLSQQHGISVAPVLLERASCAPRVRYGEEPSTEQQALLANHAVLGIFEQLRINPKTEGLLSSTTKKAA